VIRAAKYWIRLPLGFKARGKLDALFYRDFVEGRAKVSVKIPPRLVPADGELTVHLDFRGLEGARVQTVGGVVEGRYCRPADERGRARALRPLEPLGRLLLPDGGSFVLTTRLGGWLQRLDQKVYFEDSPEAAPGFGFRFSGIDRLETGEETAAVRRHAARRAEPRRSLRGRPTST